MESYYQLSDEQLVRLSQEKDDLALSLLTERYMNVAKYIANGFSLKNSDSADLVQEGMIGFLGAVYSFTEGSGASFNTYASCCIRNRIISLIRATNTKRHIPDELIVSLESQINTGCPALTPEENIISEKGAAYITDIISSELSVKEKEIFMLHLAGLSYEEISRKADITVKAVDSALQRGRKKLKNKLREEA